MPSQGHADTQMKHRCLQVFRTKIMGVSQDRTSQGAILSQYFSGGIAIAVTQEGLEQAGIVPVVIITEHIENAATIRRLAEVGVLELSWSFSQCCILWFTASTTTESVQCILGNISG